MALALKLNNQTLHTIAFAIGASPREVNEMYESANLLGEVRYIIIDFPNKYKPEQIESWVNAREDYLHEEFEFVEPEQATVFTEIRRK